jgi:mRNA interferase RelE/StbE
MYGILFTKSVGKALRKMPQDIDQRIRERLERIAEDPYAQQPNVTRLQNRPGYRLRVGDWRVICEVEQEELVILVLRIGRRGEAYR